MSGCRALFTSFVVLALVAPLTASSIAPEPNERGGYDVDGEWVASVESEIHASWWLHWSRDKDANSLDDRLEWLIEQPVGVQQDWWRRAPPGSARVFVDYDHHPSDADVRAIEELGAEVTFRAKYLDTVAAIAPFEILLDPKGVRALPGVVMVEDLGLAEPDMHEAVPTMGVDNVWMDLGLDGTGSVIAVLDTGIKGDHEGLNDMDDDPFTCLDDPPDPLDPNPEPIPRDCDPKIIAFYDAVFTDEEQDPSTSYDSGTHGSHVAGIAAGTGGGQTDPETGLRYVGAAPGAYLINILACCDGDIEDVIQGAQWAIDNRDKYGIDILTSSLGEQQFEIHVDNDGNSAWSRQMDMVVEAGITTTLSAGNEIGGITFVGCNTIDSPGDARLPITVASLDKDLSLAIYSSRGYTSDLRVKPDVATIGSAIMAPDAATQDGYISKSGTSMATPLMAGIAALMIQANPDLTPSELKVIVSDQSIEREVSLFGDAGLNDCSLLETRPDNEFGYGQADPVAFVEAAGSIDRSLNVSMDIRSMDEVLNQSYLSGTASGVAPGQGEVQVRVGGSQWKATEDTSPLGDWAQWEIKLDPHNESGNSTIYARLIVDDDHISPVDARRVILLDLLAPVEATDSSSSKILIFGLSLILLLLLVYVLYNREQLVEEWFDGQSLTENKLRRMVSLCVLYFAQGLPWGFVTVAFASYLSDNGFTPQELGTLFATVALPWTFKWIWGPVIDTLSLPQFGTRRLWILFAQFGMAVSIGTLLLVPDLTNQIDLVIKLMFVHNIFASLQDVSTDALAVDVLRDDEVSKANGYMFASKRGGMIVGGAVLGGFATTIGIKGMLSIQLPMLLLIMVLPLFLYEKPGTRLFPWSRLSDQELLDSDFTDSSRESEFEVDERLYWEEPEESRWWAAQAVGKSTFDQRISLAALLTIVSLTIFVAGLIFAIFSVDLTVPLYAKAKRIAFYGIVLAIITTLVARAVPIPKVINPFLILPQGSRRTLAQTSFNLTKAFHLRSSFMLIFLCLLAELYLFIDPIVIDIFINRAEWEQEDYNVIVGGIVILAIMIGQIAGGMLGEKYGVKKVAIIGFTCLALCNAMLAVLEPFWTNTVVMTAYLIIRGLVNGVAWICVIAVCMKMTWSKVGGTQFTAYMSMFNLSGVMAYTFTGRMLEIFDNNYSTTIYVGAVLTMFTVFFLVFIDPEECNRVLEEKDALDGILLDDLGESGWWEKGGDDPVTTA
jgi:subtilisin family serine protease/MFS family permease